MRILLPTLAAGLAACSMVVPSSDQVPSFRVDPAWPRPRPEENGVQLVLGQVAGIAVDERNGHVWIIHRPATLLADEWNAKESRPVTHRCCKSVPPVAEFDAAGNYLRDHQILKFTPAGKFLMQIGRAGKSEGSNSTTQLGRPAHMVMDPKAQELVRRPAER